MPKKLKLQDYKDACDYYGIIYKNSDTIKILDNKIKRHKMAEETKKGNVTKEQIDAWKKEHGKVHRIAVVIKKDADGKIVEEAVGYLKKPRRDHKATAMSMYAQHQILECGEFLRDNCWLGGDDRLKTLGDIADTAAIQANGIIQFKDGSLGEA